MSRSCREGFIQAYVKCMAKQKSPEMFHTWAALSTISAVLKKEVYLDRGGYYTLYPNLYVLLISPSGVGAKSTCINLSIKLLKKSSLDLNTLNGKISPTRLISRLQTVVLERNDPESVADLYVTTDEFKVFSRGLMRDSSLIEDLTMLYDCGEFEYETQTSVRATIHNPYVSLFCGTTPEWLSGSGTQDVMSGGFGARVIPVCLLAEEKDIAWPEKGAAELEIEERLIEDLTTISLLKGGFRVTKDARDQFERWYNIRFATRNPDRRLDGYFSKKHDLVLKLAMLVAVSFHDELVLRDSHIDYALALLAKVEKAMMFAYSGMQESTTGSARWQDKVLSKIIEQKRISHSDLLRAFHYGVSSKTMREICETLETQERIEREIETTGSKPRLFWKAREDASLPAGTEGAQTVLAATIQ